MSDRVIVSMEQVTADWLTGVLTHSGVLESGSVESYTVDKNERELSTSVRLKLQYSSDARGSMPRALFLKLVNADMDVEFFGPSEVNYYVRDYVGVLNAPIPRCYDGAYSAELRRYHILIDDLSGTHFASWNRPPTLDHGLALAEGLAVLHAHYWGRERLDAAGEPFPGAKEIDRFVDVARPGARHIIDACAHDLKPHWPEAMYTIYDKHPPLMAARTRDGNGFTLIHGDTNLSNILVPIEGDRPIYIVDRQPFDWSITTWLGVYDLAYTMVLKWDSAVRRQLEELVLQHYLNELKRRGVSGYTWDQLFEDYRLCVPISVYVATEWCRGGLNRDTMKFWLPMLQRAMTAYDDLECRELL